MHIQQHNVAIVHLLNTVSRKSGKKTSSSVPSDEEFSLQSTILITQTLAQIHCDFKALQISQANIKAFQVLYLSEQLKTKDMKRGMVTKKTSHLILQWMSNILH